MNLTFATLNLPEGGVDAGRSPPWPCAGRRFCGRRGRYDASDMDLTSRTCPRR